ncbi:uncharacterized protein LOC117532014 [Thalassophryne amazonica]|uniref:uncharacterized protein LOC117532014 n=1 Tax=Thalassophryne amazonica TaxID=390379 RepID=UPI001471EEFD|nr:uncharacterized protein LOC117532014 [Thalassophryne amazonica]
MGWKKCPCSSFQSGSLQTVFWDIAKIAPNKELESVVINAYLMMLVHKYNQNKAGEAALIDTFAMTAIWKKKTGRIRIDPMAHKVIVGIVNENNHWMLVVMYPHKALFVDPLGETNEKIKTCLESTRAFMRKKGCSVSRWTCSTLPHSTQQDGTSSGVLALKFAQKILQGDEIDLDTPQTVCGQVKAGHSHFPRQRI